MGESGETERQGDTVSVEKDEGEQIQVLTPEEAKMRAASASDEVEDNERTDDKEYE